MSFCSPWLRILHQISKNIAPKRHFPITLRLLPPRMYDRCELTTLSDLLALQWMPEARHMEHSLDPSRQGRCDQILVIITLPIARWGFKATRTPGDWNGGDPFPARRSTLHRCHAPSILHLVSHSTWKLSRKRLLVHVPFYFFFMVTADTKNFGPFAVCLHHFSPAHVFLP